MATSTIKSYTAAEAAEILRCDRETVYRWARKGLLRSSSRPRRGTYRFTQEHLDEFLAGPAVVVSEPDAPKPSRNPRYSN